MATAGGCRRIWYETIFKIAAKDIVICLINFVRKQRKVARR
jgi:hypothetical protein